MTLSLMMTATATTQNKALSSGKSGGFTTHLENVKVSPPQLPSAEGQHAIREAIGAEGTAVALYECYTETHSHTDDSITVNQLPDINAHDKMTIDGVVYTVQYAEPQPATFAMNATLRIILVKDKRQ